MRETIRDILAFPVVPIVVGAGIAVDGPGNIFVRSLFLLVCAAWFSLDLSFLIYGKWLKPRLAWKHIIFSTLCSLSLLSVGYMMQWLLTTRLDEQQKAVERELTAHAYLDSDDVMESLFTFTNGSDIDIGNHQMVCDPRGIIFDNFVEVSGGNLQIKTLRPSNIPIKAHGDGESVFCLDILKQTFPLSMGGNVLCADVVVEMDYELSTQPKIQRNKKYRFVLVAKSGKQWHQQGLDYRESYCPFTKQKPN